MESKGVRLTERIIPIPDSLSPEAQRALEFETPLGRTIWPSLQDKTAWRACIERVNGEWEALLRERGHAARRIQRCSGRSGVASEFLRFLAGTAGWASP